MENLELWIGTLTRYFASYTSIQKERKKKKIGRLRGGIDYGLQEDLHKERQNTTAQQGEFLFVHKLERKQTQPMRKKKDFQTLI